MDRSAKIANTSVNMTTKTGIPIGIQFTMPHQPKLAGNDAPHEIQKRSPFSG